MTEERLNRKISKLLKKVRADQTLYQPTIVYFLLALRNGRNSELVIEELREYMAQLLK